jgi:hypothetical protein
MHNTALWVNKLSSPPPPNVKDKQKEPRTVAHLSALVKQVAKLHEDNQKVCHCTEEFYLQQIRPLGLRETQAYECPRLNDPSHDPTDGEIFSLTP